MSGGSLRSWAIRHRLGPRALAVGAALGAVGYALGMDVPHAALAGWCAYVVAYATLQYRALWCADPETMRRRARALAGGRGLMLGLSVVGAASALLAVSLQVWDRPGWDEKALTVATVLLSWLYVQLRFAQDYAHEYWSQERGLEFPGGDGTPEFSEFLYVALNVGCAMQVSDATTNSPAMRKLVSLHTVIAFLFNAVILAATINLLAGEIGA